MFNKKLNFISNAHQNFFFAVLLSILMELVCPFQRFGCKVKPANEDHANAHARDNVSIHLGLIVQAFDQEVERNKLLAAKVDVLQKWIKEHDDKLRGILACNVYCSNVL
jgi:hypothetical protein